MFKQLTKSLIGVVITPITIVSDILTLPSSALDDKHPFGKTKYVIEKIERNIKEIL